EGGGGGGAGGATAAVTPGLADQALAGNPAPRPGTPILPLPRRPASAAAEGSFRSPSRMAASPAVPLGTMPVPLVPADTLCALDSGEFVLVTGLTAAPAAEQRRAGAGRAVRVRCRTVSRPGPAPPAAPPLPGGSGLPCVGRRAGGPGRSRPGRSTWAGSLRCFARTRGCRRGARCPRIRNGSTPAG